MFNWFWLLGIPLIGVVSTFVMAGQRALLDAPWFWYSLYLFSVTIPFILFAITGIIMCIYYVGHPFVFPLPL